MSAKLRIFYNTPEGPRDSEIKTEFDGLKIAQEIGKSGFNLVRQSDNLFIPPHSIIAISHIKINE